MEFVTLPLMQAQGAKRKDGSDLTLEDLLGRAPVRLVPPPELTEAQAEAQAWEDEQAAAKRSRAEILAYQMHLAQAKRAGGGGPEIVD